jgi:hypothetical protein
MTLPDSEIPKMDIAADIAKAMDDQKSSAYADEYLDVLTANWRELKSTVRKTLASLLVGAAAFELIRTAKLREATIAGLKISDFASIERFLPLVVMYMGFQLLVHRTTTVYYQRIHTEIHKRLHPQLWERKLHVALPPAANLWWDPSTLAYASGRQGATARGLGQVWLAATVLALLGFEVFAYEQLFERYGMDFLVLLSLALAILVLTRTVAELWLEHELE